MDQHKETPLDEALQDWVKFAQDQRTQLEELIADKLLDSAEFSDLAQVYWDMQKEWTETLSDEQLLETAKDLNIHLEENT